MPNRPRTDVSRKLRALERRLANLLKGRKVPFEVKTNTAPLPTRGGIARCGVAEVEITPKEYIGLAGYSKAGKIAKGTRYPLFARALYLEDSGGNKAALCFLDLWCASLYLLHTAALQTLTGYSGLAASQLILAGTHTHAGPGRYFGNHLYDTVVSLDCGFDRKVADFLAGRIAHCVNQAAQSAVPARLGIASAPVWYVSRNRARPAFLENPEAASWNLDGPGQGAPPDLPDASHFAIDPRVFCLAAVSADANAKLLGAFGTFSCHATALGLNNNQYDPDWPRIACEVAAQQLAAGGASPIVALADSAGADITPMQCDEQHGAALVQSVGKGVGDGIAAAAQQAINNAADFTVEMHFAELSPSAANTHLGCLEPCITPPPKPWAIGVTTIGGATDGHSGFNVGDSNIGKDFDHRDPQFPKTLAFGSVGQALLRLILQLAPASVLPMHTLKVAGHQFATFPGEPTITTAFRLEKALKAATGAASASIIGYAGDYSGYYPTHEEYMLQRYEGASMIRGRHASQEISDALVRLASGRLPFTLPPAVKFSRLDPPAREPRRKG
jgi:hypothetical protein